MPRRDAIQLKSWTIRFDGAQRIMEPEMEDSWFSVDEIGDYLGIKRDTVYNWIGKKNRLADKIDRLSKFKRDDVEQWGRKGGESLQLNLARENKSI